MEKIIYTVWKPENMDRAAFNAHLLGQIGPELCNIASAVRLNIQDADVEGGTSPRAISTQPQMDAVIQLWVNSANASFRSPIDACVAKSCARHEAWLVSESTAIENTLYPAAAGERTEGFSQIVFLKRPDDMPWADWREHWHDTHTQVAIETQSNFEYQQNLVTRRLTEGAKNYAAIIEECFPQAALTDPLAYFDAPGDEAKMRQNLGAMMQSTSKFIDHSRMDCIPTSQYDLKTLSHQG